MNYIDVIPPALSLFAQALDQNRSVRIIGTGHLSDIDCCRFLLDVSDIYDGPPCQWTCTVALDRGQTTITFAPAT